MATLLLVLFLYRPGAYHLRQRIQRSIASAVGRRVAIDKVRFHVLPRPGFDLEGLLIYDDPAFSAEPMIRAQEVFAAIRLRSLARGHLEIATLSATEPSINLVRDSEGRWNLARLIERNAQIAASPTEQQAARRPAFPYLEATNARINFKIGPEKKAYALTDADVALWQDSENSWGARLKAQPVRTDFNLTDTGQVQINASWQRAASVAATPMQVTMAWEKGQLGQITKLLSGSDRGWRGDVTLTTTLTGTPEELAVESRASIGGFRRYDIFDKRSVRLFAACSAKYDANQAALSALRCEAPVGEGFVRLRGGAGQLMTSPDYDLTLELAKVPVASAVALLLQAKQQLPSDLVGIGSVDAEFHAVRKAEAPIELSGDGEATGVHLLSSGGQESLSMGAIPLTLVPETPCCERPLRRPGKGAAKGKGEPEEARLRVGPATITVNASPPITVSGWVSGAGYKFSLSGETSLKSLFRIEDTFGVPAMHPAAEGATRLDLSISGSWQGLSAPTALGSAELRGVRAEMRGLNVPIEIAAATISLTPEITRVEKIAAQTGNTHWSGTVEAPRRCAPGCDFQFDLTADQAGTADLAEWLRERATKRPWYRILAASDQQGPSPLLALKAHGRVHVGRLNVGKAAATQLSAQMAIDRGKVLITGLHAQFLHGMHQGDWIIEASGSPPRYHGTGNFQDISLAQAGSLMNTTWISGTADGRFELECSGATFRDLLTSGVGKLDFNMRNGSLTHIEIPRTPGPLPVSRFTGTLETRKGVWELSEGRLESRDGVYQVRGTATTEAGLNITFTRGDEQSWNVTGTLAKPHSTTTTRTEVSRKEPHLKAD